MPFSPPTWATPELIAEYGAGFLCCFVNRAHFENCLATGDLRRPASIRAAARLAADPVRAQREVLRRPVDTARRSLKDAEGKIAEARKDIAESMFTPYRAEQTLKAQTARLAERQAALKRAETDLEIFDLMNP